MTDPAAAQELKCPQPGGEAVADRDKSDRCQGDTPSSGERLRDDGQAGRSGGKSPILSPETMPADPVAAPVDQERIDAARARIKRTVEYLDSISADSPYEKFGSQRLDLRQALDLLDPEVKLA